ncbi:MULTISPECIES: hypothetical protein [Pseudomonas]|uniref:Uncharacterized protein n=1 Tax=Pseudomonas yamanorum TaxID=515393 RepID=A0A7Y8K6K0_9PSED|nr:MULTISPECIES: hypothetical protein [Pseudomonas]MDF3203338.1 hypothetical protein [Pseudomonas sp. 1912-s]NWE77967.1 hypothetical protein [Pseudomonas yamanorum]
MTPPFQPVTQVLRLREAGEFSPFNVVITALNCTTGSADLVIGGETFLDREETLTVGKSVLVDAGKDGFVQIRLMTSNYSVATIRLASVPIQARLFGTVETRSQQTSFTPQDLDTIRHGLDLVLDEVRNNAFISAEQFTILKEQLDEAAEAAKRLSRKDWVIYFLGILASVTISAGFSPDAAKALMHAVDHSIGQGALFAIRLLSKI